MKVLLRAVRAIDRVVVRALVNRDRSLARAPRRPGRVQAYGQRYPVRAGGLLGTATAALMVGICAVAGWRFTGAADALALVAIGAGAGLLLALTLRWERMAKEALEHIDRAEPFKASSVRSAVAWIAGTWVVLTVMWWSEDARQGSDADWLVSAVCAAVLTVLVSSAGFVVALVTGRRRSR
ncbi:hypothetical protein CG723_01385 [Streptomyces sp. CB01635]|uniref:hypothetical protein n=1 Tax=unclassified Streptomyces TaxID=2593676 RepID=UPI000C280F26|nr:hypothetical protein [Streptomyces sp. CB01635]PJN13268.1 hypothetical protein CG723_01385 [Streptomyces sp. CB01635]